MSNISFVHAKKRTRGELRLPQLHFIACDDWMEKVGERAFCAWLKFYSWADRSESERDFEKIPGSLNKVAAKLGISKPTFYGKIIKPLWEYGFIDLVEYNHNNNICMNIIVYEYPQNDPSRSTTPLEKIRDYDKDYDSKSRQIGKKGGLRKAELKKEHEENGVVKNFYQVEDGKKTLPPLVKTFYQGGKNILPNNDPNRSNESNISNDPKIDQSTDSSNSVIQNFIDSEPRLTDRRDVIMSIHSVLKNKPGYSDALFILTLKKSLTANIHTSLENYVLKAMLNNMNNMNKLLSNNEDYTPSLPESVRLAMEETAVTSLTTEKMETHEKNIQKQLRYIELLYKLGELTEEDYEIEVQRITDSFGGDILHRPLCR